MAAGKAGRGAFGEGHSREIEEALTRAREKTGLRFSVWVGHHGQDSTRTYARRLHAALGSDSVRAVLLAVDPVGKRVEIVTGEDARSRVDDRTCALAATSMTAAFGDGDLAGGITDGLAMLADHAGRQPSRSEHA